MQYLCPNFKPFKRISISIFHLKTVSFLPKQTSIARKQFLTVTPTTQITTNGQQTPKSNNFVKSIRRLKEMV